MSVKYFCDKCGKDIEDTGRTWIQVGTSSPNPILTKTYYEQDLCPTCFKRFMEIVEGLFNDRK